MSIKFSVVIPLYNKEAHIERTVMSVLEQTVTNFELLVVNDGSTDNSANVVSNIIDPRIKLIQQTNMGEGAARNTGIRTANGQYVCFLDADDAWKPWFLEKLEKLQRVIPNAVIYATAFDVVEYPGAQPTSYLPSDIDRYLKFNKLDYIASISAGYYLFCSSSVCLKKDIFDEIEAFSTTLKIGADIDMWTRACKLGVIAYSEIVSSTYFRDAENRSTAGNGTDQKRLEFITHMQRRVLEETPYDANFGRYVAVKSYELMRATNNAEVKAEAVRVLKPLAHFLGIKSRLIYHLISGLQ